MKKQTIGRIGEELTCKYLISNNYKVLERNFRCRQGEIDVIAFDIKSRELVFIEVKTRTNFNFGFPSEAVNEIKKKHIIGSAKYYLYLKNLENTFIRIDVVEIVLNGHEYKLNHLKGVI